MLKGATGKELKEQWDTIRPIQSMKADLDLRGPKLLITGDLDQLFPPTHFESLVSTLDNLTWIRVAQGDHVFSTCRSEVVKINVDWLLETLGN